jgi:gluconokinase
MLPHDVILAIDVGTSSARAALYDEAGRLAEGRFHRAAYQPTLVAEGGVEHDPQRLLDAVATCVDAVLHGSRLPDVAAVGVATFWHGLLGFDAAGHPLTPIYMWADTRSAPDAAVLHDALDATSLHARTGCPLHSSYWPAKLRWLERQRPDLARVERWGSFGEYLELRLFGEAATSVSMASGTGVFNTDTLTWDPIALAAAELEERQLFPLCDRRDPRRGLRPEWARRWPGLRSAVWFPAVGDGAASNVGSGCMTPSRIALNLGTSTALRIATTAPEPPPPGLWRYRLDRRLALVGGALSEGGNVYGWCRDVLRLPADEAEIERALAAIPSDAHGLTVLPFLAGERAPGWRGHRRAAIAGLGLETTAAHVLRAALEAVALRIALVYLLLEPRAAARHEVVASGGMLRASPSWVQTIADAIGHPVTMSREQEATGRGAALLALEAAGRLPDLGAAEVPPGQTLPPDRARHARLREALERQRRLDDALP